MVVTNDDCDRTGFDMEESSAGKELTPANQHLETRKAELAAGAMAIGFDSLSLDIEVDLNRATKLSLGDIATLGSGFSSLSQAFQTVTQSAGTTSETLFRITDKSGNPLDASVLQKFRDGSGRLGSYRDASGSFKQAHLKEAASQAAGSASSVPVDPTTLFMAAALMEINKKLDAIQETQQEMFEYLKNQDKAKLRGNLETLMDILSNYRFNWDNAKYKNTNLALVQGIRKDARQAIIQHRAEIKGKLKKKGFVHVDKDVRDKAAAVRSELEEYRLAVYLFSFSSFIEIMLLENFDSNYLQNATGKIEEYSIGYRELYTQAYDLIEADAESSVRAMALGGLSNAMGFLGKALEKTPVAERTSIDKTLIGAGKDLGDFNKDVQTKMMSKLTDARSSDVRPFIDNIETVNRLYNEPVMLLADCETIYFLPTADEEQGIELQD